MMGIIAACSRGAGTGITYETFSFTSTLNGVVQIIVQYLTNDNLDITWTSTGSVVSSGNSASNIDLTGNTVSSTVTVVVAIPDGEYFGRLILSNEGITSFDVSSNTSLEQFFTGVNYSLSVADISNNVNLYQFTCNDTVITAMDISNNTLLTYLAIQNTSLTSTEIDDVYIQLDNNGLSNGTLIIDISSRTSASDTASASLITKGWSIQEPQV